MAKVSVLFRLAGLCFREPQASARSSKYSCSSVTRGEPDKVVEVRPRHVGDYFSQLDCEHVGIRPEELVEVAGEMTGESGLPAEAVVP